MRINNCDYFIGFFANTCKNFSKTATGIRVNHNNDVNYVRFIPNRVRHENYKFVFCFPVAKFKHHTNFIRNFYLQWSSIQRGNKQEAIKRN